MSALPLKTDIANLVRYVLPCDFDSAVLDACVSTAPFKGYERSTRRLYPPQTSKSKTQGTVCGNVTVRESYGLPVAKNQRWPVGSRSLS